MYISSSSSWSGTHAQTIHYSRVKCLPVFLHSSTTKQPAITQHNLMLSRVIFIYSTTSIVFLRLLIAKYIRFPKCIHHHSRVVCTFCILFSAFNWFCAAFSGHRSPFHSIHHSFVLCFLDALKKSNKMINKYVCNKLLMLMNEKQNEMCNKQTNKQANGQTRRRSISIACIDKHINWWDCKGMRSSNHHHHHIIITAAAATHQNSPSPPIRYTILPFAGCKRPRSFIWLVASVRQCDDDDYPKKFYICISNSFIHCPSSKQQCPKKNHHDRSDDDQQSSPPRIYVLHIRTRQISLFFLLLHIW